MEKGADRENFLHPNDFYIRDNEVWVADTWLLKLSRFDIHGNYETLFTLKYHPIRVDGYGKNLIVKTIASEYAIKRLTYKGKQVGEFGKFLVNQGQSPLSTIGYIETYDSTTIFAPMIAGLLYYFRSDTLYKMARRPDGQNFMKPEDRSTNDRMMYVAPRADIEARTLGKTGNLLYVGEYIKSAGRDEEHTSAKTIIDFYECSSGKYQYSLKAPLPTKTFQILDNILIAEDDSLNKIRTFKFEEYQL